MELDRLSYIAGYDTSAQLSSELMFISVVRMCSQRERPNEYGWDARSQ